MGDNLFGCGPAAKGRLSVGHDVGSEKVDVARRRRPFQHRVHFVDDVIRRFIAARGAG